MDTHTAWQVTTVVALLGCGLMAGLFFAFSISVMPALRLQPGAEAMAAMQRINDVIVNPVFMIVFLGTPLACLAAMLLAFDQDSAARNAALAGGASYLLGGLGVTAALNVPMNNRLAAADAASVAGQERWAAYLRDWTRWNHLRTLASLLATLLLALALIG